MEGGRGTMTHSSGASWANFEENAKDFESQFGPLGGRNPLSPTAGRLCREDMAIYGEEPALDSLSLVVCKQCGRVVKSQALLKHEELYHSQLQMLPKAPHHPHHPHHPPTTPTHTIGQSSKSLSTIDPSSHREVVGLTTSDLRRSGGVVGFANSDLRRGGGVLGFTASNLPSVAKTVNASAPPPPSSSKASKEYDANRHCGVWLDEERRHCMHSLTCKVHPVSERRKVAGRSRPFDELVEQHKQRKRLKKFNKHSSGLPAPSSSSSSSMAPARQLSPARLRSPSQQQTTSNSRFDGFSPHHSSLPAAPPSHHHPPHPSPSTPPAAVVVSRPRLQRSASSFTIDEAMQVEEMESGEGANPLSPAFPRPLAVCGFGGRSAAAVVGGGVEPREGSPAPSMLFTRRTDRLRSVLAQLSGRGHDLPGHTHLHRKHSFQSLLEQKRASRKYYNKRDRVSLLNQAPFGPSPFHPRAAASHPPPSTSSSSPPSTEGTNHHPSRSILGSSSLRLNSLTQQTNSQEESRALFSTAQFYASSSNSSLAEHRTEQAIGFTSSPNAASVPAGASMDSLPPQSRASDVTIPEDVTTQEMAEQPDVVAPSNKAAKRPKAKRGRRAKHHRRTTSAKLREKDSSHDGIANATTTITEQAVLSNSLEAGMITEADGIAVIASEGSGVLLDGQRAVSPSVCETNPPARLVVPLASEAGRGVTGGVANSEVGVVNSEVGVVLPRGVVIKQEPVDGHEDRMDATCEHSKTAESTHAKSTPSLLNGMVLPGAATQPLNSFNSLNSPQSFLLNPSTTTSNTCSGSNQTLTGSTGGLPGPTNGGGVGLASPHSSSIFPLAGSLAQSPSLSPQQLLLAQQLQQTSSTASALLTAQQQAAINSAPNSLLSGSTRALSLPEALQRRMLQQNALLFASSPALFQRDRQLLLQQQLQQQQNQLQQASQQSSIMRASNPQQQQHQQISPLRAPAHQVLAGGPLRPSTPQQQHGGQPSSLRSIQQQLLQSAPWRPAQQQQQQQQQQQTQPSSLHLSLTQGQSLLGSVQQTSSLAAIPTSLRIPQQPSSLWLQPSQTPPPLPSLRQAGVPPSLRIPTACATPVGMPQASLRQQSPQQTAMAQFHALRQQSSLQSAGAGGGGGMTLVSSLRSSPQSPSSSSSSPTSFNLLQNSLLQSPLAATQGMLGSREIQLTPPPPPSSSSSLLLQSKSAVQLASSHLAQLHRLPPSLTTTSGSGGNKIIRAPISHIPTGAPNSPLPPLPSLHRPPPSVINHHQSAFHVQSSKQHLSSNNQNPTPPRAPHHIVPSQQVT